MHPSEFADEAKRLVAQMTLQEKAGFCSGSDFWHLKSLDRLGLGRIMVSDGPHGLRKQAEASDHLGMGAAVPATCFPAAGTLASAWDPELCRKMGEALAMECAAEGVAVILGPGINIKRNPLCGRNFEYFSEDPMLAGTLAAAFVAGVQAQGIGCSLKHFAAKSSMAKVPTLAAPELDSCTSSERAWRLCAARHSQGEDQPLGAPPRPQLLERAASKVADLTAFDRAGQQPRSLSDGGRHDRRRALAARALSASLRASCDAVSAVDGHVRVQPAQRRVVLRPPLATHGGAA